MKKGLVIPMYIISKLPAATSENCILCGISFNGCCGSLRVAFQLSGYPCRGRMVFMCKRCSPELAIIDFDMPNTREGILKCFATATAKILALDKEYDGTEARIIEHVVRSIECEYIQAYRDVVSKYMKTKPVRVCAYCEQQHPKKRCSGCLVTSYCSDTCQLSDWKTHKDGCRIASMGFISPKENWTIE